MSDEETVSDDSTLDSKAWQQMEKTMQQFGYREGASKGRDAVFQSGFDEGYLTGFQSGKALGQAKGLLCVLENLDSEKLCALKEENNDIIEKIEKVPCALCAYGEQESNLLTVNDVNTKQTELNSVVIKTLQDLKSKTKKVGLG